MIWLLIGAGWLVLSVALGIVIGKSVKLADEADAERSWF